MPDGSDPGRVEKYTDRQVERVRRCVREPNRSDILSIISSGGAYDNLGGVERAQLEPDGSGETAE